MDVLLSFQVQFVDSVLGSGLLLYLSPTWLSELYQQTVTSPLMDVTHVTMADCPLLQMLEGLFSSFGFSGCVGFFNGNSIAHLFLNKASERLIPILFINFSSHTYRILC